MMDFLTEEMRRDPYPLYRQLREMSPVFHQADLGLWMLFDHASVKRALTDHESFSSAVTPPTGKAPDWLIFTDPPRHSKLRGIIMKAFTPRAVAALEPRIRARSQQLLDALAPSGEADLVAGYSAPLPALVIAELIGIPPDELARFLRWADGIIQLSYVIAGAAEAATGLANYAVVREEMAHYLPALLEERRRDPREDLLSRLVEAEVDGARLTEEDLLGFFQLLLLAGIETTTNTINNAVLCFSEHPDAFTSLREDRTRIPQALEEVLRFRSPTQFAFRETRHEVELHGQKIPPGQFVLAMIGSANRDPKQFEAPDRFDISRAPNPHIAFGHGIHFCIGAALARLEARVALEDLTARFPALQLASSAPWTPRKGLLVHGPAELRVRWS